MSDEDDNPAISVRDWRLTAITYLTKELRSPTGVVHPIGTPVEQGGYVYSKGELLGHTVPHPSALFLSASASSRDKARSVLASGLAALAETLPSGGKRIGPGSETEFFDCIEALASTVVFAHTAIEALSNHLIPDEFVYKTTTKEGAPVERTKRDIERWDSLDSKLDKILPLALQLPSPKGTGVWQRYEAVKSWRDRVTHIKTGDVRGLKPETAKDTLWTALLDKEVLKAPEYAATVMTYYFPKDLPRWLRRFSSGNPERTPGT